MEEHKKTTAQDNLQLIHRPIDIQSISKNVYTL